MWQDKHNTRQLFLIGVGTLDTGSVGTKSIIEPSVADGSIVQTCTLVKFKCFTMTVFWFTEQFYKFFFQSLKQKLVTSNPQFLSALQWLRRTFQKNINNGSYSYLSVTDLKVLSLPSQTQPDLLLPPSDVRQTGERSTSRVTSCPPQPKHGKLAENAVKAKAPTLR